MAQEPELLLEVLSPVVSILQRPVFHQDMSIPHGLELHLDLNGKQEQVLLLEAPTLHRPELYMDVSTLQRPLRHLELDGLLTPVERMEDCAKKQINAEMKNIFTAARREHWLWRKKCL